MKNFLLFYTIAFSLLLCTHCRKPGKLYAMPDAVKHWAYFKKGSYWIYVNDSSINTATPLYDSLYIIKNDIRKFDQPRAAGPPEYAYERAEIKYQSTYNQNNPLVTFNASDENIIVDYCENNLHNTSIACALLAFNKNLHLISWGNNHIHKAYHNQLEINGTNYTHVAQTEINSQGRKIADFYIAKQKWIVKKVYYFETDTISWSLCRQKIIQ